MSLETDIEIVDKETGALITAGDDRLAVQADASPGQTAKIYLLVPFLFLIVTLLGGLRLGVTDNAFIFLRPALICLVFGSALMVLIFRARLIRHEGWFSDDLPAIQNVANAAVLFSLFTASTQMFNSLLPEKGLPFWVISFCFLWTLWNNLFLEFDTLKLLRSLASMFALAFVVKYLLLANLTSPGDQSWLERLIQNPAKEAFTWLLDLPRFAPGTGYLQFVAIALYLIGLFLTPATTRK